MYILFHFYGQVKENDNQMKLLDQVHSYMLLGMLRYWLLHVAQMKSIHQ